MKIEIIKLYGEINSYGRNSAEEFNDRLSAAAKIADEIHLHIHSPGGNCFEGNLIYNYIKQCEKPVDVYIDGMAASMASIIMLAGRKIYMSANAFVMIHAPSTWGDGNAEDFEKWAKLLRSMEDILLDAYSAKTGKDKEALKEWMSGENWFSAKEAEAEGLIDGIVEASELQMLAISNELKKMPVAAIYKQITASINQNKNKLKMDKQKLIDQLGLTGVTAESSDEEIQAAIQAKIDAPTAELKKQNDARISACIEAAITAGKISKEQRSTFEAIADKNGVTVLEDVLGQMKTATSITDALKGAAPTGSGENRADWNWERYQKEDPRALEAMEKNDPEKFRKLYNTHYTK